MGWRGIGEWPENQLVDDMTWDRCYKLGVHGVLGVHGLLIGERSIRILGNRKNPNHNFAKTINTCWRFVNALA